MVATLAVHDEIGKKIEVDAIATLILPQLWAMVGGVPFFANWQLTAGIVNRTVTQRGSVYQIHDRGQETRSPC